MQPEDEAKRLKEQERAVRARAILDSPLWDEAYTTLVNAELERMLAPGTDPETTLECKRRILALNDVKRELATVIQTGELAQQQLEEHRNARDKRRAG